MRFQETERTVFHEDLAVVFASYEERSRSVVKALRERNFPGKLLVFYCEDLCSKRRDEIVEEMVDSAPERTVSVPVSFHDPVPLARFVSAYNWPQSIVIDISCFNRGNLYPFLWASRFGQEIFPSLTFAYAAPDEYGKWLSRDYEEPCNMLGFPGPLEFERDRLLICSVGFEVERALKIIQAAEPSKVVLALGTRPTKQQFLERNQKAVQEIHGSTNFEICEVDVSTPYNCLRHFEEIANRERPETVLHFAPLSTKLSCLAVWALWLKRKGIRVWNAQPKIYNIKDYSRGSSDPRYFQVEWDD